MFSLIVYNIKIIKYADILYKRNKYCSKKKKKIDLKRSLKNWKVILHLKLTLRVKDILTRRFKRCSRNSVKIFKTQNWKKTYNYLIKKNVIIKISDNNNELIFFVEYSNNCLFRKNLVHPVHAFVTFTDKKLKYPLICTKSVCIYIYMYASRKYISLYIDWIHVVLNIFSFLTIQFTKEIFHIYKEYDKRQFGEFFWNLIIETRGGSSFFIANIKMPFVMNKYISLSSRSIIYFLFFLYIYRSFYPRSCTYVFEFFHRFSWHLCCTYMDFSIDIRIYEIGGCPGTRRLFHIRTDVRTVREIFHEHLHRVKFATCNV